MSRFKLFRDVVRVSRLEYRPGSFRRHANKSINPYSFRDNPERSRLVTAGQFARAPRYIGE
ncbi:hypothetical protein K449DRAFT_388349 [Hypoxylon sp. EC38]|nr:hypothetical protein K449DRAFT_388349 [Hypoxylon sp. EC38]